jgi:hypothetical protein
VSPFYSRLPERQSFPRSPLAHSRKLDSCFSARSASDLSTCGSKFSAPWRLSCRPNS